MEIVVTIFLVEIKIDQQDNQTKRINDLLIEMMNSGNTVLTNSGLIHSAVIAITAE
jgi:preprotein translocase subunit YajC